MQALADKIRSTPFTGKRRLVALVGPPASGKSTLAHALADQDASFMAVPMDGFHLDNGILTARGLLARKGAPETFDAQGFKHLVQRLAVEDEVIFPTFDRSLEKSIAGAGIVTPDTGTVIIEGNYLLLDAPVWRDIARLWDVSIFLSVPRDVLYDRMIARWLGFGYSEDDAAKKANGNDMLNVDTVLTQSLPADLTVQSSDLPDLA